MKVKIIPKASATYYASVDGVPDTEYKVEILDDGPIKKVSVNGTVYEVDYNVGGNNIHSFILNNSSFGLQISFIGDSKYEVKRRADLFQVTIIDELEKMRRSRSRPAMIGHQVITARMPGLIQKIYVELGEEVKVGDPLCVLVAMKMENEIRSQTEGVVKEIFIKESDKVSVGDRMMVIE